MTLRGSAKYDPTNPSEPTEGSPGLTGRTYAKTSFEAVFDPFEVVLDEGIGRGEKSRKRILVIPRTPAWVDVVLGSLRLHCADVVRQRHFFIRQRRGRETNRYNHTL